jgi:acyl-CoA reductase-like NAD-dependent aldehyde dehydrogenase
MLKNLKDFLERKEKTEIKTKPFIDGKFRNSQSGLKFKKYSPIDNSLIGAVDECDENDIDIAVQAAKKSFSSGVWSRIDKKERKKVLLQLADLIRNNLIDLAIMETIDIGKPIKHSCFEISRCADCIQWYAEAIDKIYDDVAPTKESSITMITREPIGVVGGITPWNYPLMMAVWKFAPALACGNSFVLKPAEQSPLSSLKVAELAMNAGIPEGVFNVVPGFGPKAGKALALHMDVEKICFTGSTEVGKLILQYSGSSNMKRVSLECGGKSPNIVFADAKNLDNIAKQSVEQIFYNSGQVCDAPSRLIVDKRIKHEFLLKVLEYSKQFIPSNPMSPETIMGSMVDKTQFDKVLEYIEIGKKEGAHLALGGKQVMKESGGFYIEPTIFTDVKNSMRISQEEIFGPVLCVLEFETIEEAIEIANDSIYGLNAIVWTSDINIALSVSKLIKSGKVLINGSSDSDMSVPHSGFKRSGFGIDKSIYSLDEYLHKKLTWIELEGIMSSH